MSRNATKRNQFQLPDPRDCCHRRIKREKRKGDYVRMQERRGAKDGHAGSRPRFKGRRCSAVERNLFDRQRIEKALIY